MFPHRVFTAKHLVLTLLVMALFVCFHGPAQAAQVTLAWDANVPAPEGYRLFQRAEGGSYNYSAPVWSGTTASCTISNLADSTTYYYVVRAFVGSDVSGDSNEVTFRYDPPVATNYTITASAGSNGTISPAGGTTVAANGSQSYTITPNTGYQIASVLVDGASVGAVSSYTFSAVNANHTISATFTALTYTITSSAGSNGAISPAGSRSVTYGGSQSYTITPNTGYQIASVLVDGASVGAVSSYTFSTVNANHTISATFTALTYTITSSAGSNGAISPAGSRSVTYGGSQSYTITPSTGYQVASVLVDGASVGAVSSYTFSAVNANHSISAQFQIVNQPPTADAWPDQTLDEGQQVILSGLNSMDNDGGIASFQWRQIQGTTVALSNASTAEATFTAPNVTDVGTSLTFELTVTDNNGTTAVDTCIVNVTWINEVPTAAAGADQTVSSSDLVTLNGSGSADPDDGIAAYHWVQTQGDRKSVV
jgi:hypothetical protein